jgi:hypothetical protein
LERTIKRHASNEAEVQVKRVNTESVSANISAVQSPAMMPIPTSFISASQVFLRNQEEREISYEISDAELLEMALEFEKKHPA